MWPSWLEPGMNGIWAVLHLCSTSADFDDDDAVRFRHAPRMAEPLVSIVAGSIECPVWQ